MTPRESSSSNHGCDSRPDRLETPGASSTFQPSRNASLFRRLLDRQLPSSRPSAHADREVANSRDTAQGSPALEHIADSIGSELTPPSSLGDPVEPRKLGTRLRSTQAYRSYRGCSRSARRSAPVRLRRSRSARGPARCCTGGWSLGSRRRHRTTWHGRSMAVLRLRSALIFEI
jgi:hypothetical protein